MSKSLGRGLSSLITSSSSPPKTNDDREAVWLKAGRREILEVTPAKISPNPHQPRKHFSPDFLNDLMESIREHGILQPLVVTERPDGGYELVAGERRLRAAQALRLKSVPVLVRTAGELEKLELSLIENIQRQDLNPIERASAYKKLVDDFSLTHEQAAKRMGKSRPVISNALRMLELPGDVQKMIADGRLSESISLAILEVDDPQKQVELAYQIAREKLTKNDARRLARRSSSSDAGRISHRGDTLLAGFARELEARLQTTVKVGRRGKTAYVIEIEAYSREELESLVKKLTS